MAKNNGEGKRSGQGAKAAQTTPPKAPAKEKTPKKKQGIFKRLINRLRRPAVRKIYKTTDGYFNNKPKINKKRRVAVIDQRRDDKAVAVVKIFSEDGKDGKSYIANLTLTPEEHKALTKNSKVGNQVYIGVKQQDGSIKQILIRDFEDTDDKLTRKELRAVKKGIQNDTKKHRKTYKKKMRRWKKHFKK